MKFNDNMSVPPWKVKLLQNKQRKKEEEKRKEREAEEERLRKLPPWKRQAEQPKTVIIIDKDKGPNAVDLTELSKHSSSSSKSKPPAPLVNGTAQKGKFSGESLGNQGKVGRDEADSGAGGVSEEHCAPVQDNVFLTLERKKRRAPPPPKTGSQINVIASNVPGKSDPVKSSTSSKKTLTSESSKSSRKTLPSSSTPSSESVKENHIQPSSQVNGPSVIGNQTQSSTKSLPSEKSLKETVPKSKTKDSAPPSAKIVSSAKAGSQVAKSENSATKSRTALSGGSAASSSKESPSSKITKKEEAPKPASITQVQPDKEVPPQGRRKSISELRGIFGGVTTGNITSHSTKQVDVSGSVEKAKSQKTSNDERPSAVSSASKSSNSTSNQKVVSTNEQSVKKDSKKPEQSKKILDSTATKSESKSLPPGAKSPSPSRNKPSSELPASAIISLTNEGPLKSREGQLVRSSSVIDDDEEITISLDSPRSPPAQSRRISRSFPDSEKDASSKPSSTGTESVSNGSVEKRRAPSAPQSGMVNGSAKTDTKDASSASKNSPSESIKPPSTSVNKIEEKNIEYPKNFRDPNFVPKEEKSKKEETAKKEEIPYPANFRKPDASATINKHQDLDKKASAKVSTVKDNKKEKEPVQTVDKKNVQTADKKTDQTKSHTTSGVTEKKNITKTKEAPPTSRADDHIPYPEDFRRPKAQQTENQSKDKKDILKPSDLIKISDSSSDKTKDNNDNVTSSGFMGVQLRKTKKPEASGINIVSESSKTKVDNSPKAPPTGLVAVGVGGSSGTGKKKNVVKKFEKVEFIGYNSPAGKASALKAAEGKNAKKGMNVSFSSKEEETFEYMSEDAYTTYYDETHQGDEEKDGGKKSPTKMENGMKNGTLDNSYEDDDDDGDSSLKSNAPIRSSGGFQNLASANLSAMDVLLGRGPRPAEPEPPKPAPPPEPEQEPEDMSLRPMDSDLFSSAGHGTAAILF